MREGHVVADGSGGITNVGLMAKNRKVENPTGSRKKTEKPLAAVPAKTRLGLRVGLVPILFSGSGAANRQAES